MFAALKFLLIFGALLKCCYGQVGGYGANYVGTSYYGGSGGTFIIGLLPLLFLGYILLKVQLEKVLENACEALFEDVEIMKTRDDAIKYCEDCADHKDEEECNDDKNCDYEDGTCFVSGDYTSRQTCCSYLFTGDKVTKCQACLDIKTEGDCNGDCKWIPDTSKCFYDL